MLANYGWKAVLGFLFFLAFVEATRSHQVTPALRGPVLVGRFLLALILHGGCQQWWIEPVLRSRSDWPLMLGATLLIALNDHAAITYLASLVPGFSDNLRYAVVVGAVAGGGLTVIANALNPAGQSNPGFPFRRRRHLRLAAFPVGAPADRHYGGRLYAPPVDQLRGHRFMPITIASPPRLSIIPFRLATRCRSTPFPFFIHILPLPMEPRAKPERI
jgi:hypothetical protein